MGIFLPKHGAAAVTGPPSQRWLDALTCPHRSPGEELGDYPGEGLRLAPGPPLLLVVIGC